MCLKGTFLKLVLRKYSKMSSVFHSAEKPLDEIRNHLSKFSGGSVDLIKKPDDGLAIVVLNHETKKNAMSGKMMVDLFDVVEDLNSWTSGKGVLLKGSSGNFCSGGDLDFVRETGTPEEGFMMSTYMQHILSKFQRLPLISVALVEGIGALGGGSELAVACDFILTSKTCQGMGFVHAKMGIVPAWGGTNRLVERVGYTNALEVVTRAKVLTPRECLAIGLVNEIIPATENHEEYALSWLRERTRCDPHILKCIKTSLCAARDFPGNYEAERRLFAPFWGGPAHREALGKNIKHKRES